MQYRKDNFLAAHEIMLFFDSYVSVKFTNEERNELYGLYMQATKGDNHTWKPIFSREKQKWTAWKKNQCMDKDTAKNKYIEKANKIISYHR